MTILLAYLHMDDIDRLKTDLNTFARKHLPQNLFDARLFADDADWVSSPLADRPRGQEFLTAIGTKGCQHVVLGNLQQLFDHASIGVDAVGLLTRRVPNVWLMKPEMHIQRGDAVAILLGALRGLDTSIVAMDKKREKAVAKRRQRGLRRPADVKHEYGFKILHDEHGNAYRVPDEEERELMRQIIELRDVQGMEWAEIHTIAKKNRIKNRHGGPISQRALERRYAAAVKLFASEAETSTVV